MIARSRSRQDREPTIALINIVFLMLIFFLVAGTIAPALDGDLKLVTTSDLDGAAPPDAIVIHADGRLLVHGTPQETPQEALAALGTESGTIRLVPDRDLPATDLLQLGTALRMAGAKRLLIVSERALQ